MASSPFRCGGGWRHCDEVSRALTRLRGCLYVVAPADPQISTSRITAAIMSELPQRTDRRIRLIDSAILGIEYVRRGQCRQAGRAREHAARLGA